MMNPRPVNNRRSPYSVSRSGTPSLSIPVSSLAVPRKKRSWKKILGLTVLTVLIAGTTYVYAQYQNLRDNIIVKHQGESSSILGYDPSNKNSVLDTTQFTKNGDGRFNMLVVGVGGEAHKGGPYLTDSMQVVSVDTINKKVTTTSVPRDLYVMIPGYGRTKINAAYEIGEERQSGGGAALAKQVVSNVLGVKISNFVLIDFAGVQSLVDSLGGIDINVPKSIYDPYFPDVTETGYAPFSIKAGLQHMDGATALKYSRSRETTSDFDRSARQQLVMQAIKKKALSLGVLSNPSKINGFLTALGQHVKTDMQVDQIKSFLSIYRDISSDNTSNYVLDTSADLGLLNATTDPVAGYIEYPVNGFDKFDAVHEWFIKNDPDPLLAREQPTITVANGGRATDKQMQNFITLLKDYGYNATLSTDTISKGKYSSTTIFQTNSGQSKPISKNYLSSQFNTAVSSGSPLGSTSDFELIYFPTSTTSSSIK